MQSAESPRLDARLPLRSDEQIAIRKSGEILTGVLDELCAWVKHRTPPTPQQLDSRAAEMIVAEGGEPAFLGYGLPPYPYPSTLCLSVNAVVIHGIPTSTRLRPGDLVSLDLGVRYRGMYTDAARTVIAGQKVVAAQDVRRRLLEGTECALQTAVALVRAGNDTGQVSRAIEQVASRANFYIPPQAAGHGIGRALHERPVIANVFGITTPVRFAPGCAYAIEPIFLDQQSALQTASDRWSISAPSATYAAHSEATILLTTEGGVIIAS